MSNAVDAVHMAHALRLARRGLGSVWPNPAVGCVIIDPVTQLVLGRGCTQPGGRPHAETVALAEAGERARGATAFVSLEPCSHHGKTPPCADALVEAGVKRVVVAMQDPDPRVSGSGIARLQAAGIAVDVGVGGAEAAAVNAGFLKRVEYGLPLVTLKMATSLDGLAATVGGESQWITGPRARSHGHWLRASHDAIMIGRETALHDDPMLTCRLPGLEDKSPVRVVLDSALTLPQTLKIFQTAAQIPTWVITRAARSAAKAGVLSGLGVKVINVDADPMNRVDLLAALRALAQEGITRLLVEGGATLAMHALRSALVDRVLWYRAGLVIGEEPELARAIRLKRSDLRELQEDIVETYELPR